MVGARVLLAKGADPNRTTKPSVETGAFMRDCRTRAETPLHRAAALVNEDTNSPTRVENPRSCPSRPPSLRHQEEAEWSLRPDSILRKLCYGGLSIHPERRSMDAYLHGQPHA